MRKLLLLCVLTAFLCSPAVYAEDVPIIGIIGSVEEELSLLKESMDVEGVFPVTGMLFYKGRIAQTPVVAAYCGLGKVNAGICAQTMIRQFDVSEIVNIGLAGALSDEIDIGDIVISTDAVQYDFDASGTGSFEKGEIPYTGRKTFPAGEELQQTVMKAAREAAPEVSVFSGRICSGDQIVSSVEKKEEIRDLFGGLCCEMESGAIAQVCYLNEIPFVSLRAISYKAGGPELMDYDTFKDETAVRNQKVILRMLELTEEAASAAVSGDAVEEERTMVVAINANMRDAPHGELIRIIPSGQTVIVHGTAGENNDWYEIEIYGIRGYVYHDLLRE